MIKANFNFKGEETIIEIPTYLKIINDLTNELAIWELSEGVGEEGDVSDVGYMYLVEELTTIFCKEKNIPDDNITIELIRLTKEEIKNNIEMSIEIVDLSNVDKFIEEVNNR